MSDFDLRRSDDGRYGVAGEMTFDTAEQILRGSEAWFRDGTSLQVDLSQVTRADSAGLAVLLEWRALARSRGADVHYSGIPESLSAIAKTTEVEALIR